MPLSWTPLQVSEVSRRGKFQGKFLVLCESFNRQSTRIWGCKQNLDPPSGPLNFFSKKIIIINLSYTQCVYHIPPLLSQFTFLRFSVQLERRCSPLSQAFPSSHLVFPRGIRNSLAITYSDVFAIFKLHGLPPFCFPPSWRFR